MTEPLPPPEGGRLVPFGVLNWYEVVDTTHDINIIDSAFANPVSETVLSVENPAPDACVLNQLVYDNWSEVVRELHSEATYDEIMTFADRFMKHHTTEQPTEGQHGLGALFG